LIYLSFLLSISYDRPSIQQHLRKVGHFDPITRQALKEENLISNHALKEVLETFLEQYQFLYLFIFVFFSFSFFF